LEQRILPATFNACRRTLSAVPPLPYVTAMLDALLVILTSAAGSSTGAVGASASFAAVTDPWVMPGSVGTAGASAAWDIKLPYELWLAVFRASYRRMEADMPQKAALITAASADADVSPADAVLSNATDSSMKSATAGSTNNEKGQLQAPPSRLIQQQQQFLSSPGPTDYGNNAVAGTASASVGLYNPGNMSYGSAGSRGASAAGGGGGVVQQPDDTPVGAVQLVSLAYSLARHPPPRPPPPRWMQLLLLGIEADVGSLDARRCADLCVALQRLGWVPGGAWMRRFGLQVELSRALTERAEHSLLSEAWLGLRRM
ncbi:hypothetical protein Agub_g11932, partial [Astrephomene gubernaculifera]